MAYTPRLKEKYNSEIINNLKRNYKSVMQVPKLVKISLNHGVGNNSTDKKFIDTAQQEMTAISGQKALDAKQKLEGMKLGKDVAREAAEKEKEPRSE